jgi:hypothetical protein
MEDGKRNEEAFMLDPISAIIAGDRTRGVALSALPCAPVVEPAARRRLRFALPPVRRLARPRV